MPVTEDTDQYQTGCCNYTKNLQPLKRNLPNLEDKKCHIRVDHASIAKFYNLSVTTQKKGGDQASSLTHGGKDMVWSVFNKLTTCIVASLYKAFGHPD